MLELRPATPEDDHFLAQVYAGTRQEEMDLVPWSDLEKSKFLEMQHRAQTHSYTTRFPDSEHNIILIDGQPAGRIWTDEWEGEIRLLDIALLPEFRGRGTGTLLLKRLQDRAEAAGKALRHSVHTTNTAAIRLYERLGFTIVDDYEFETHHLMEWSDPSSRPAS